MKALEYRNSFIALMLICSAISIWWFLTQPILGTVSDQIFGAIGAGFGVPLIVFLVLSVRRLLDRSAAPLTIGESFMQNSRWQAILMVLLFAGSMFDAYGHELTLLS